MVIDQRTSRPSDEQESRTACIFGCAGLALTKAEAEFFARTRPFGFILFERNLETAEQIRALTRALRNAVGSDCPIFIDQEGGRVQRLHPPHWRDWPPPLDTLQGCTASEAAQAFKLRYRTISDELMALGINGNCVPVADLPTDYTHPVLRNRCLGRTPAEVVICAAVAAAACLAAGVLPVVKHMPGQGRATIDSHLALPRVTATLDELEASDFLPFRALCHLPLAMTAHVVFDCLDAERPATLSETVITYLRRDIEFEGLLLTDDISMQALDGDVASRCERALAAGCDIILHCNGELAEMKAVADVVPAIGGETAHRCRQMWQALTA